MSRYIDADALKKRVSELIVPDWTRTLIRSWLDSEPTVDAVPVVHGYNKQFKFPSQFTCSVCGWESWDTYCGDTDTFNYCPNCGAKMDGADGERIEHEQIHKG